jgi:ATP-binding cassette subfamily B protein
MNENSSVFALLLPLHKLLNKQRHNQFYLLLILAFASSFAEVISLGAVVPFIGILTQPEKVYEYLTHKGIVTFFHINSPASLILPLTIGFALAAIIAAVLRLMLQWVSLQLSNGITTDLGIEVYRRTLYRPYSEHVALSSSEVISGITQKVASASGMFLSLANLVTSAMLFVSIITTLLVINPIVASVAMVSFGSSYAIIAWKSRARIRTNGEHISREQTSVVRALQEGLGGIRDILLDGTQNIYCNIYRKASTQLQKSMSENTFINQAPRFGMEGLGMVLVAVFAYVLSSKQGGIGAALPALGSLALGAQRLLPLLNILYSNWSSFVGGKGSLLAVVELINHPVPEDVDLPNPKTLIFKNSIRFDNVHFKYKSGASTVLDGINFSITKGSRIGFVGSTGSGKSTALDLFMALLEPTEGRILIDEEVLTSQNRRSWQQILAHVPQNIYLADGTIAENIAFGVSAEKIDMERVKFVAERAQLKEFIESRSEGYNLFVGERGVRLSGGQRQRIGIARALYKQASVLIFDEATSALDSKTENEVMNSIGNLSSDLTILIVAHRISTLQKCDLIMKLEGGKLIAQGPYNDFIKNA